MNILSHAFFYGICTTKKNTHTKEPPDETLAIYTIRERASEDKASHYTRH